MTMFPDTISIDFGASTTKVAFRAKCEPSGIGEYSHDAKMFAVDSSILIPTMAIETGRSDKPWFFGREAEQLTPSPEMKVHRNWKADLLRPDNGPEAARSAIVAHHFFHWLREKLLTANALPKKSQVRILLPAFDDFDALKQIVIECMRSAGWKEQVEFGNEPRANALGLLSEGRNVYRKGKRFESLDFGSTFGQGNPYIQAARRVVLNGSSERIFRMAIWDIGAFTTDLAILQFNVVDSSHDGLFGCTQHSVPIGAYQGIELPLFGYLKDLHGFDHAKLSASLFTEVKKTVLAGKKYAYRTSELGDSDDQEVIGAVLENFVTDIWSQVQNLIGSETIHSTYLTGGVANIPRVAEILRKHIPNLLVAGLPDSDEQLNLSKTYIIDWKEDGDAGVRRIATALGGCSFLYSDEISTVPSEEPPTTFVSGSDQKPCICRGMNPDCWRCDGSGYV